MQIEEIAQKVLGCHVFQAGLKDILEDIIGRETIELNCISEQIANQIEDIVERAVENETRHQFVARLKLNYELHNE